MNLKKKTRLFFVLFSFFIAIVLALTTAVILLFYTKVEAYNTSIGNESSLPGYVGNLLSSNNSINQTTYNKLMAKLGSLETAKAKDLNNSVPIIFQMGTYSNKPIYWQVVYKHNNFITVWMTQPYTVGSFNYSDSALGYSENANYSKSNIRTKTLQIYDSLVSSYPIINDIVATPEVAASDWQTTQINTNYEAPDSDTWSIMNSLGVQTADGNPYGWSWESCMQDKFWIPSYYEVHYSEETKVDWSYPGDSNERLGFWGLSQTEKGFYTRSLDGISTDACWLRSGYSLLDFQGMRVHSNGRSSNLIVSNQYGIRPAAHISLASFLSYTADAQLGNSFGNVNISPDVSSYKYNTTVTLTATPDVNYEVDYWTKSIDGGAEVTIQQGGTTLLDKVTANVVYRVYFKIKQFQVSVESNNSEYGSVSIMPNGTIFDSGSTISIYATPAPHYQVSHWTKIINNIEYDWAPEGSGYPNIVTDIVSDNTVYKVYFKLQQHRVSAVSSNTLFGTVAITPQATYVDYGTKITLTATPAPHYAVAYWTKTIDGIESVWSPQGGEYPNVVNDIVQQDTIYKVYFEKVEYTVTYSVNNQSYGSISVLPNTNIFTYSEKITLTASPTANYEVDYWTKSVEGEEELVVQSKGDVLEDNITGDTAYKVYFKIKQYIFNIFSNDSKCGTIRNELTNTTGGDVGIFDAGTTFSYRAIPNENYIFLHWKGIDGTILNSNSLLEVVLQDDSVYVAVFVYAGFSVNSSNGGGVSVNGYIDGEMQPNDEVTIVANGQQGYAISGWICSDGTDLSEYAIDRTSGKVNASINLPYSLVLGKVVIAQFKPVKNENVSDDLHNAD